MLRALVANRENETNARIVRAGGEGWLCVTPAEAVRWLCAGDVALGRLDVLPGLDGIDGGLRSLGELEAPLRQLGPRRGPLRRRRRRPPHLRELASRDWYVAHCALVQELVARRGFDLRILVADGHVVGAVRRVATEGEWRTNVALGARSEPVVPPLDACRLAVASADLVGVDLLPVDAGWTVLELNGAVDFTDDYSCASARPCLGGPVGLVLSRRVAGRAPGVC